MVILEFSQIVDILVDDDPEGVGLVMRRHVACTESLGHGERNGVATEVSCLSTTGGNEKRKEVGKLGVLRFHTNSRLVADVSGLRVRFLRSGDG